MEQFRSMSSQYYRGAKAAVVCYGQWKRENRPFMYLFIYLLILDVTVGESFGDARFWIKEVQKSEPVGE